MNDTADITALSVVQISLISKVLTTRPTSLWVVPKESAFYATPLCLFVSIFTSTFAHPHSASGYCLNLVSQILLLIPPHSAFFFFLSYS